MSNPFAPNPRLPVRTGTVRDFDFLAGSWAVQHRTLKHDGAVSERWTEFSSTSRTTLFLDGALNVEECKFPGGRQASAVRTFQAASRQWAIYWVEAASGILLPPVFGGFEGDRGEFYGEDTDNGTPVMCRFVWSILGADRARWEQAYSADGSAWKTNWVMDFARIAER